MRIVRRTLAVATLLSLGACTSENLARRDSLSFGAGDAVATNIATHTIDPASRASRDLYPSVDGERSQRAAERYRTGAQTGAATQPGALSTAAVSTSGSGTTLGGTGSTLR